jgi:thiosulfate/3-mercaptopyruvate sulfurtransferase
MPLLPRLVRPEELRDALGDERVRVFDATVFLRRAADGGPYTVESGFESYARGHIPGAAFADIPGALSDPAATSSMASSATLSRWHSTAPFSPDR